MELDRLMNALITLGVILIGAGLFLCLAPPMMNNTQTASKSVSNLQTLISTFLLDKGDRFEGYFTVVGGDNDIKFSIKDPNASIVLDAGTVIGRRDFAFTAEFTGAYNLTFDNIESLTGKTIFLSYSGTTRFPSSVAVVIALFGLAILTFGVSLVVGTRRNRPNSSRPS